MVCAFRCMRPITFYSELASCCVAAHIDSARCVQVIGSPEQSSRLLLCEATAVVMRQCFSLLGMKPLYRI